MILEKAPAAVQHKALERETCTFSKNAIFKKKEYFAASAFTKPKRKRGFCWKDGNCGRCSFYIIHEED